MSIAHVVGIVANVVVISFSLGVLFGIRLTEMDKNKPK